ncbi:DUF3999 family protein [Paraburkholderia dipogonis]|uniref:DUF3999 family protein n=1 Tax=Paraburkholderia dipogonis TaxID=1211383 RepID=UPI0035E99F07
MATAGDAQLLKVSYQRQHAESGPDRHWTAIARVFALRWLDGARICRVAGHGDPTACRRRGAARGAGMGAKASSRTRDRNPASIALAARIPSTRLRLNLPQPKHRRAAVVYSAHGGSIRHGAKRGGRDIVPLAQRRGGGQSNPSLELTPDTDRQWRVVGRHAQWRTRQRDADRRRGLASGDADVFVARGTAPFTLAVGSAHDGVARR